MYSKVKVRCIIKNMSSSPDEEDFRRLTMVVSRQGRYWDDQQCDRCCDNRQCNGEGQKGRRWTGRQTSNDRLGFHLERMQRWPLSLPGSNSTVRGTPFLSDVPAVVKNSSAAFRPTSSRSLASFCRFSSNAFLFVDQHLERSGARQKIKTIISRHA